ncbi:unannotated protein [freshwater metagenome]|uniref:Unannotated protein n=1 Tax=freshwater metagenome TaxID=449393 RepID=A0A6J7CRE9_9ZZZZ
MEVLPRFERLDESFVAGQVRHDSHLNLRIVGGEKTLVRGVRNERCSNLSTNVAANGDVLEVWFRRREPTRRRPGLIVARVNPTIGLDTLAQNLDDLREFCLFSMLEQAVKEWVGV